MSEASRPLRDACPGALRVHDAADGGLARVRVVGGALTARQFRMVADAARELGDGRVELTSRANLQVRGLAPGNERALAERLAEHGLLPSETHERVRNILASPCADGRELVDTWRVSAALDRALCATPELADLPGRFLFAVDDGRGDVAALDADVALLALPEQRIALLLAGADSGVRVPAAQAARAAVTAARAFLNERPDGSAVWRMSELGDRAVRRVADRVSRELDTEHVAPVAVPTRPEPTHAQVGEVFRRDGRVAVAVGAALGRLTPEQADTLADASEAGDGLRLTAWRTLILTGLPEPDARRWLSELDACGLVVHSDSARAGVTACTGRPGCAKALADVRTDAERAAHRPVAPAGTALPVHWVGCERRCGRPQGRVVEVLATEAGYEVGLDDEVRAPGADIDQVSAAIDAARRTV